MHLDIERKEAKGKRHRYDSEKKKTYVEPWYWKLDEKPTNQLRV